MLCGITLRETGRGVDSIMKKLFLLCKFLQTFVVRLWVCVVNCIECVSPCAYEFLHILCLVWGKRFIFNFFDINKWRNHHWEMAYVWMCMCGWFRVVWNLCMIMETITTQRTWQVGGKWVVFIRVWRVAQEELTHLAHTLPPTALQNCMC